MKSHRFCFAVVLAGLLLVCGTHAARAASPYAHAVVSYATGSNYVVGYATPTQALGAPSTDTGAWPSGREPVTPFTAPWESDQIVSIGAGGELVVAFDHRVEDDPANPFGMDLLVFGGAYFLDSDWPNGIVGDPAGALVEPASIEVSQDGVTWFGVSAVADGLFPTDSAGDPTLPVNPALTLQDFAGMNLAQIRKAYSGSAGGAGVDLAESGLSWIRYVKIIQDASDAHSTEVDALVDVAPATLSPFAAQVVAYASGDITPGYDRTSAVLGQPEVDTAAWPSGREPVTPFTAPWEASQILNIGATGELVLQFDHDVVDDPDNPYGLDLIVFGNAFFMDSDWPNGLTGDPASAFVQPASIAVSDDGETWHELPTAVNDLFPTDSAGDPTVPVDPELAVADFSNLDVTGIRALYDGSAGGAGVDIAPSGLAAIRYVKIYQDETDGYTASIDALADVAPSTGLVLPATPVVYGDVNGANGITNLDALMINSYFLGMLASLPVDSDGDGWGPEGRTLDQPGVMYGDLNGDNAVSNLDALIAQAKFLGTIDCVPADTDCDGTWPEDDPMFD